MIFPHNGKVITVDQLTHYEPCPTMNLDKIIPLIGAQLEFSPFVEMGPGIFQDPLLLGTYQGDPPCIPPSDYIQVCTITSITIESIPRSIPETPPTNDQPILLKTTPHPITQIPLFYPTLGVTMYEVETTLTLINMVITILVWYLEPPYMVLIPSLHPQTIALPMQTPVQPLFPQLGHKVEGKNTNTGGIT
jgi:hypothetical protein